jgi:hypothetical protein
LAEELRTRYPRLTAALVELFKRIAIVDQEASDVNRRRPANVPDHLHSIEREVRGQLVQPDISLTGPDGLRLPVLDRQGGSIYAWPLAQPSLVAQMIQAGGFAVPRNGVIGPGWHEKIDERNRQLVADAERAAAQAEARQREREEREAAEIAAAKEQDRQAYAARGWPPP